MLAGAEGALLDSSDLVDALEAAAAGWASAHAALEVRARRPRSGTGACARAGGAWPRNMRRGAQAAEADARKAAASAANFRPAAARAAGLFFVLADMDRLDPSCSVGLAAYAELFTRSVARSGRSERPDERVRQINLTHTGAVLRSAGRCGRRPDPAGSQGMLYALRAVAHAGGQLLLLQSIGLSGAMLTTGAAQGAG